MGINGIAEFFLAKKYNQPNKDEAKITDMPRIISHSEIPVITPNDYRERRNQLAAKRKLV